MKLLSLISKGNKEVDIKDLILETDSILYKISLDDMKLLGLIKPPVTRCDLSYLSGKNVKIVTNINEVIMLYLKFLEANPRFDVFARTYISREYLTSKLLLNTSGDLYYPLVKGDAFRGVILTIDDKHVIMLDRKRLYNLLKLSNVEKNFPLKDYKNVNALYTLKGNESKAGLVSYVFNANSKPCGIMVDFEGRKHFITGESISKFKNRGFSSWNIYDVRVKFLK